MMRCGWKIVGSVLGVLFFLCVHDANAYVQEHTVVPAVVTEVAPVVTQDAFGLDGTAFAQDVVLNVRQEDGTKETVSLTNDFAPLSVGDRIYVYKSTDEDGVFYSVYDIDRRFTLLFIGIIFAGIVILFGGRSGVRSLVSLALSITIILYVLMPVIASGHSPLVWGIVISVVLLAIVMGVTHGFRPKTYAAFLGTSSAVVITGILAALVTRMAAFSGIGSEEAFFLSVASTSIDMANLLLTGIIIGMLGVLDDVAITQAAVVMELKRAGVNGAHALYTRAMVVGREHVGALINTLVLAYAGASLPLFLLLATYNEPFGALISIETVAVEIVRALVGSVGLVLAVPITTFLATYFTARDDADTQSACAHGHNG